MCHPCYINVFQNLNNCNNKGVIGQNMEKTNLPEVVLFLWIVLQLLHILYLFQHSYSYYIPNNWITEIGINNVVLYLFHHIGALQPYLSMWLHQYKVTNPCVSTLLFLLIQWRQSCMVMCLRRLCVTFISWTWYCMWSKWKHLRMQLVISIAHLIRSEISHICRRWNRHNHNSTTPFYWNYTKWKRVWCPMQDTFLLEQS